MTPIEIIINAKNNAKKVLEDCTTQMKTVGTSATSMAASVASSAAGFAMAQIGINAFSEAISKAKAAFIDYNASMETTRMAFDNLLKSSAAADFFISKLQKFSRETPFEFPDLQAASKMMLGLGWAARDILPALTAVGNAMAATGTSGAEMTNVIMSISQMKGAGMLDAQNLKELDRRGLAATQILTNHFKMSIEQIQKSGKDIDEIIGVLINGMNEKFAGAMDKQKGTWNQLTSNLGDEWGQIAGELGTPIFDMFKDTLVEAENWSSKFLETMQDNGLKQAIETMVPEDVQDVFKELYNGTVMAKDGFFDLAEEITDTKTPAAAFASIAKTTIKWMKEISSAAATAAKTVADLSRAMGSGVASKDPDNLQWYNAYDMMGWIAGDEMNAWLTDGKTIAQYDEEIQQKTAANAKEYLKRKAQSNPASLIVGDAFGGLNSANGSKTYPIVDSITKNVNDISNAVSSTWAAAQKKWDELSPADKWLWRHSGKGNTGNGEAEFNKNTGAQKMKFSGADKSGSGKGSGGRGHFIDFDEIIEREREAMASLQNEAKLATAKMVGDKKWQAETEYEIAISNIEKEYFRKQEITKGNFEAEAALQEWYDAKTLEAFQEKTNKIKDIELEEYDRRVEQNNLLLDLDKATKDEVNQLNRRALDEKIAILQKELATAALTKDREIELEKQLADAKKKALALPQNEHEAFYSGMKQQTKTWNTYFQDIQNIGATAAQSLNSAFNDFFFDAITGQMKSLGDYLKSFWQGVARAISQMFANMFANKIISSLFGNFLGGGGSLPGGISFGVTNGLKFKATGGPVNYGQPYIVGERGPELFVPQSAGSIVPNRAISTGNTGVNVVVNVQNNTGVQAAVSQETKFDGESYIVNVVMKAIATNKNGLRTVLQGAR